MEENNKKRILSMVMIFVSVSVLALSIILSAFITARICQTAVGPQGETGEQGLPGEPGDTGPQGEKGETGATGASGEKGDVGAQGPQGDKGEDGIGIESISYTEDGQLHIVFTDATTTVLETPNPDGSAYSAGLSYRLTADCKDYILIGIGDCVDTDIQIPPTHNGLPVIRIEEQAFSGYSGLTSIVIPDSVESIGQGAFLGCDALTERAGGVSYSGRWAITCEASVTAVQLKSGTVGIGDTAFADCSALKSIYIPDSVSDIGARAFYGCSNLTGLLLPDSITSIGEAAFALCDDLTDMNLPDGLRSLSRDAFRDCTSLSSIFIPADITTIETGALAGCRVLKQIHFGGTVAEWESIQKADGWDSGTPAYTVHCTDGQA